MTHRKYRAISDHAAKPDQAVNCGRLIGDEKVAVAVDHPRAGNDWTTDEEGDESPSNVTESSRL